MARQGRAWRGEAIHGNYMRIAISMCRRHPDSQHPDNKRAYENLRKFGLPIGVDHHLIFEFVDGMSLLPWARSLNIAACLGQGADYIFIVDDDVWFRREDIASAIKSDLPIVGFPVFLKTEDINCRTLNYSVLPGDKFVDPDKDFRHVARIGTGAMLVKAEVFRALQKTRPFFLCEGFQSMRPEFKIQENCYDYFPTGVRDLDGAPRYIGEDYGFCMEAASVGYPAFAHGTSVTAHMIAGHDDGFLCDMNQMRYRASIGDLPEGKVFNI
jgi:hypothetical protein